MIKCNKGKLEMDGAEAIIVAEFMTIAASFRESVLMSKFDDGDVADCELRRMIEEVIRYCREEKVEGSE